VKSRKIFRAGRVKGKNYFSQEISYQIRLSLRKDRQIGILEQFRVNKIRFFKTESIKNLGLR